MQVYMRVDAQRIQQILINLLSNAIKFSKDDSQIFVSMELAEGDSNQMQKFILNVQDFGIGISDED